MIRCFLRALALIAAIGFPGAAFAQVGLGESYIPGVGIVFTAPIIVGASGMKLHSIKQYAPSLTPAATAAAIGTSTQTFTVTGLAAGDQILVMGPAPTSLCPMVGGFASAANTLSLEFSTLTAAACTPASGTYKIIDMH